MFCDIQRKFLYTTNAGCLKVDVPLKVLISQSECSGPRKFTWRYQLFEITGVEISKKI